jgi:3D (Asp-Asp-Asp) domain-containing protein
MLCAAMSAGAFAAAPKHKPHKHVPMQRQELTVSASAYNATSKQTDGNPYIGAWGDHLDQLKPGFRAIAVSPDLAAKGLTHHKRVRIKGFKGEFLVLDRTPVQWQNTIDIFMDGDVAAARKFGRKEVTVYWSAPAPAAPAPITEAKATPATN